METLLANLEDRTVTGLLLPYGETSRPSNIGPVMFARGTVAIPADPSIVTLNIRHQRENPVGRATVLEDTNAGIVATFSIAKTPEGDAYLADVASGKLNRLSAEVRDLVRSAADKVRAVSGALFGAAGVDEGAFKSATLYAELASESHSEGEYVDENGVTWRRVEDSKTEETENEDGSKTYKSEYVVTETPEAPAEEEPEEETEETTMAAQAATVPATVPQTLLAGAGTPANPADENTMYEVAHALAAYFGTGDATKLHELKAKSKRASELMFAALNDIKISGVGQVGTAMITPQWLGDVWGTRTYERKYVPLLGHAPLTALTLTGYRYTTEAAGGDWTGNKGNVPTNTPATEAVSVTAARWAGGHDIAREFVDFSVPEFWVAHFRQMTNSYGRWSDTKAITDIIAGATAVEAGTVPSGINAETVLLVDGALALIENDVTPKWAVAATDVYRALLLQSKDDIIATLSLSLGLETGSLEGFKIIPSTAVAAGKVLVGSDEAGTFHELPGVPIRTEALDMVKGGVDHAFFGYAATVINSSDALALVSPNVP